MNIRLNDKALALTTEEGANVAALLTAQGVTQNGVAIALNGAVLPRSRWPETPLNEGDEIHLFTAIAGG